MHPRRPQTTLFLIASILLAGFLAGCGGGDRSGGGSGGEQGPAGEAAKKEGGKVAKQAALRPKIALGTVTRVKPARKKMEIRAVTGKGVAKQMSFKITKNATITLDDEVAKLADIEDGQQAQITYVVRNEVNRAREVALISDGGTTPGAGENTG
jgi:hypothetical protein